MLDLNTRTSGDVGMLRNMIFFVVSCCICLFVYCVFALGALQHSLIFKGHYCKHTTYTINFFCIVCLLVCYACLFVALSCTAGVAAILSDNCDTVLLE